MERKSPLQRVTDIIGGRSKVAELCDVTVSAVGQWFDNGVPLKHILPLEKATARADDPVTARELLEWSAQKRREQAAA